MPIALCPTMKILSRSTSVDHSEAILNSAMDVHVIGVDEAQFFDEGLPDVCQKLALRGVRVIVSGIGHGLPWQAFRTDTRPARDIGICDQAARHLPALRKPCHALIPPERR